MNPWKVSPPSCSSLPQAKHETGGLGTWIHLLCFIPENDDELDVVKGVNHATNLREIAAGEGIARFRCPVIWI
jgi:hypothetical protein